MPKMRLTELQALLEAEKSDALSAMQSSSLSDQRSKAMDYYLGDQNLGGDMPAPADRSKAVSSDVADTVEGLMPSLMEIFASGDDVVEFDPVGPEDDEAAQQETDYVNHVFWHKNHGFLTLYTFLKDGLLQKNGVVKVWWETKEEEETETYLDLDDDAFALVQSDPSINIVEHTEKPDVEAMQMAMANPDPNAPPPQPKMLHDITVQTKRNYGYARCEPVPPEEFGITRRARSVHVGEADYCFHETRKTQAELIDQGYDSVQVDSLPAAGEEENEEEIARDTVEDSSNAASAALNKATRLIRVTEHYVKFDYEQNGKARLYKVVTGGSNQVLRKEGKPDIEPMDWVPFAAATPVIMTHRFFGRSIADLVMDIMRIKTAILRSGLDNIYLANNQRIEIAETHSTDKTLDDLLTNRPGGIVRTKQPGGLLPIVNQDITAAIYPMLEYQDAQREWRTGVTRQGQGLDAKALADQSATAAAQLFNMAQARTRLVARIFAETGVRDLFLLLHATIRKHGREQQETIRLRNKWVNVDPRNWKTRNDMTVNVGISSGSKDQMMVFLTTLLGIQKEAVANPQMGLANPGNIYNTLKKIVHLTNQKSVEPFFTDPDEKDEQGQFVNRAPPPPDPKQAEMEGKMQLEQAKLAAQQQKDQAQFARDAEMSQQKQQQDVANAAADRQLAVIKANSDAEVARYRIDQETALKREQMAAELQLKREQLTAELQLKREMALASMMAGAASTGGSAGEVNIGGEPG